MAWWTEERGSKGSFRVGDIAGLGSGSLHKEGCHWISYYVNILLNGELGGGCVGGLGGGGR